MFDLLEKHTKFVIFPVLAVIFAALTFHSSGYISNGWGTAQVGDPDVTPALIIAYILLMFAAFTKDDLVKTPLVVLGSLTLLLGSIPRGIRVFEYYGEFYQFANYDYWHILTIILLCLLMNIALIVLAREQFISARTHVIDTVKDAYAGRNRILTLAMAVAVIALLIYQLNKIWNLISQGFRIRRSFLSGYQSIGDYSYELFYQIIQSSLIVLIAAIGLAFLQPLLVKWIEIALAWNELLKEFTMNSYLTRKISSALYGASYILISALTGIAIPVYLYEYLEIRDQFFAIGFLSPILVFPILALAALPVWFLCLLVIRLAYEFTNAIIHIAENTRKGKQAN